MNHPISFADREKNLLESGDARRLSPAEHLQRAAPLIANLAIELTRGLIENRWNMIISEGVSARVSSLAIRGIMKKYAQLNNLEPPALHFISPKRLSLVFEHFENGQFREVVTQDNNIAALNEYIGSHAGDVTGRALLFTDFIHRGTTIQVLGDLLYHHGIDYDIAALAGDQYGQHDAERLKLQGVGYYAGDDSSEFTESYECMYASPHETPHLRSAIGVEKNNYAPLPKAIRNNQSEINMLRQELYGDGRKPGLIDTIYHKI